MKRDDAPEVTTAGRRGFGSGHDLRFRNPTAIGGLRRALCRIDFLAQSQQFAAN